MLRTGIVGGYCTLRSSRLDILLLLLVIAVSASQATSCQFPCNSSECSDIDISGCGHGLVKDVCECCDVCGKGPYQWCGLYGKCGDGLICTEDGLSGISLCLPAATTTASSSTSDLEGPTTDSTTRSESPLTDEVPSPSPTTELLNTSNCTNTSTVAPPDESINSVNCREPCSVSFCSDRARICSATGLEFEKVAKRNGCQHTSCNSCFLLVRPDCGSIKCDEPPTKRCLREYYECIRDHYFNRQPSSEPIMLKLDDSRAPSREGTIICHIPEVEEDLWRAG